MADLSRGHMYLKCKFSLILSICITELSGIDNIGLGIELELPSSELELNCLKDFVPDSELNWNCYYRNWNLIAKTELTPALQVVLVM